MKPEMKMQSLLGMSDGDFMKEEPNTLQQAIMGNHFDLLIELSHDEVQQIVGLLRNAKALEEGDSIEDIKHAIKGLDIDTYTDYVKLVDSFDTNG